MNFTVSLFVSDVFVYSVVSDELTRSKQKSRSSSVLHVCTRICGNVLLFFVCDVITATGYCALSRAGMGGGY